MFSGSRARGTNEVRHTCTVMTSIISVFALSGPLSTISNHVSILVNCIVEHLCDAYERTVVGCAMQVGVRP